MTVEITPDDKEKLLNPKSRQIFGRLLVLYGYKRDSDGGDHCGKCWNEYTKDFSDTTKVEIENNGVRLGEFMTKAPHTLRVKEGWMVQCTGLNNADFLEGVSNVDCNDKAEIFVSNDGADVEINRKKLDGRQIKILLSKNWKDFDKDQKEQLE